MKKLLVIPLCLVLLLGAVGAYSYIEVSSLEEERDSLQDRVSKLESQVNELQDTINELQDTINELQDTINELQDTINELNDSMNGTGGYHVFEWQTDEQKIVDGILRMELNFSWANNNLSIIVKINDQRIVNCLHLTFDISQDGKIGRNDTVLMLLSNNEYWVGYMSTDRTITFPLYSWPSPYHECIFEPNVGCTYIISLPIRELLSNDLIYVYYAGSESVGVQFRFGLEV